MNFKLVLFTAVCSSLACNSGVPAAQGVSLTRITKSAASAACPAGGVVIAAGVDTNANGTLEAAEVTQTNEVCSGTNGNNGVNGDGGTSGGNGYASLISSTNLEQGSTACPGGGVHLDFGFDDGALGGTAGNNQLEPGEIRNSKDICSDASPYFERSVVPPEGPAGANRISTNGGGAGLAGQGGQAGTVFIGMRAGGTSGGHVKVFRTGVVDAGFSMPEVVFAAGERPMSVSSNYTVRVFRTIAEGAASGLPFFQLSSGNDDRLFTADGGAVTALTIASTANVAFDGFATGVSFSLTGDLKNDGTVTSAHAGADALPLSIYAHAIVLSGTSRVDSSGLDGGMAAPLSLTALTVLSAQGSILAAGGSGHDGARIALYGDRALSVSGVIDCHAGSTSTGYGAYGGEISLLSRDVHSAATLRTSGGDGEIAGGPAGQIVLTAQSGEVRSSGTIEARGGRCSGLDCSGGAGGAVEMGGSGSTITSSSNISTSGGWATGAGNTSGGRGGPIFIHAEEASGFFPTAAGTVRVSGNLIAEGGQGATGVEGGPIEVSAAHTFFSLGQEIALYGFAEINANGGNSTRSFGGGGGKISIVNAATRSQGQAVKGPGGSVVNYAAINARSGDGSSAGTNGSLTFETNITTPFSTGNEVILNFGAIDLSAGMTSSSTGGSGGEIRFVSMGRLQNSGALKSRGGTNSGGRSNGGSGGGTVLRSIMSGVVNEGSITSNGGSGGLNGGQGGNVSAFGHTVTNSAALSMNGGNGAANGGRGGIIYFYTLDTNTKTMNTGTLSVAGGTGTNPGPSGTTYFDISL